MNIDQYHNQQPHLLAKAHEWHRSLESVLSERKSIDAFRVWLRVQRKDDALDLYLAIIAFRRHARRNDQRASSIACGISRRYISPRTGLCDFLPIQMRNDLANKITNMRNSNQRPDLELFDQIAPLVWSYLCEQHALFVCSKEFATVLKTAEQSSSMQKMAELTAARNASANARVPPLIGFAKYRVRDSGASQRSRPRSEPPGRRNHRNHTNTETTKKDLDDQSEQSFPIIRHDRPEDREMFVQMICEKLAGFNTNERIPSKSNALRETDLTSDNDNEQRLIQRGDSDDPELEEPWDDENSSIPQELLSDWSVNPSARIATTRGGPMFFEQKQQTPFYSNNTFMHKSASIGFSDVERFEQRDAFRGTDSFNLTYPNETPFLRNQLYAVHKHLVAPLSNKYAYHHVSRDRFPPPPAPNRSDASQSSQLHNNGTYQQFSDSSGFCSSESAHFQFTEPRRHHWPGSRLPRDNSFPFDGQHYSSTTVPSFCSPQHDRHQLILTYKDNVTGVPYVAKLDHRPIYFRDFRKCFGIPSNTNKRFFFKSVCDEDAPYQLTAVFDDNELLPVFNGKIIAECKESD